MGDNQGRDIKPAEARFRVRLKPSLAKLLEGKELCSMALGLSAGLNLIKLQAMVQYYKNNDYTKKKANGTVSKS